MSDATRRISIFVMDVDGTLTDGKIYIGENGELCKAFNIKDGYGICHILPLIGARPVIITGRKSIILENRCRELGITELYQGVNNKKDLLVEISHGKMGEIAYIGDDLNDYECMQWIKAAGGIVGCPSDAAEQVVRIADYVSKYRGGDGAVRGFIDWILSNNKRGMSNEHNLHHETG